MVQAPIIYWDDFGFRESCSGISRYIGSLDPCLRQIGVRPQWVRASEGLVGRILGSPGVPGRKLLWPQWSLGRVRSGRSLLPFIWHGLANFNLPLFHKPRGARFVLTLHDLIPLLPNNGMSWASCQQFRLALPRALRAADRILCVSPWTKSTLLERFPFTSEKTILIPNGASKWQGPSSGRVAGGTRSRQLLYVARHEPYKQLDLVPRILKYLPGDVIWTIVTDQRGRSFLDQEGRDEAGAGRLKVLTGISDSYIQSLYRKTDAYIHLSQYEGFGLPVWEALAAGAPVVYQSGHALDELSGLPGALGLAPNTKPAEWADAVTSLTESGNQGLWESSVRDFLDQRPGWESAARKLRSVYNSLV